MVCTKLVIHGKAGFLSWGALSPVFYDFCEKCMQVIGGVGQTARVRGEPLCCPRALGGRPRHAHCTKGLDSCQRLLTNTPLWGPSDNPQTPGAGTRLGVLCCFCGFPAAAMALTDSLQHLSKNNRRPWCRLLAPGSSRPWAGFLCVLGLHQ